ncbi:FixH family protein [Oceanisphaera sp. IT1-181]|uniref:FixH family protein n=1 Tax=Oceanisphaera sp. IT1-181 TaxID=3081199 RepID=UPI0029C9F2D3|nr:FixH family protein [Oceanisphaera sp. IT1-181]
MQRPWYRQFWPWFLIVLPMCAVAASLYTFYLASSGADSMVVDDYYKKGRAYNKDLTELKRAAELKILVTLSYEDSMVTIKLDGAQNPREGIRVNFTHPTLEKQDHNFVMTTDAAGVYRERLDSPLIDGAWHLQIEAIDGNWRIQKRITLPIADSLLINAGS